MVSFRCLSVGVVIVTLPLIPPATIAAGDKPKPAAITVLDLPGSGTNPENIDYAKLPRIRGTHVVVSPAILKLGSATNSKIGMNDLRFQLHNYLVHHDGRFWCIWSDGPPVEDEPTQEVRYATSRDGVTWSKPATVTGTPEAPYAFIARGLWVRNGELLALAAHFKGKGAFGVNKQLELRAYAWDKNQQRWRFKQKVYDNAINNFPPQKLSNGDWILTRRDARFNVSVLVGGRKALNNWKSYPVVRIGEVPGFRPDEPIFWPLADRKTLFALYRDNSGSRRLFHSTSTDQGRMWGKPVITNFPNATSKLFSLKTSRGYRVLILNANPKIGRRELHLAVSTDGRRFTRLALLAIPTPPKNAAVTSVSLRKKFQGGIAGVQYPHAIEHDGQLLIAFSRAKKQTELFRVPLDAIDALLKK